jgi:hypothetical protein
MCSYASVTSDEERFRAPLKTRIVQVFQHFDSNFFGLQLDKIHTQKDRPEMYMVYNGSCTPNTFPFPVVSSTAMQCLPITQPDPYHADAKLSEHSRVRAAVSLCLLFVSMPPPPFHAVTQAPLIIHTRVDNEQGNITEEPLLPNQSPCSSVD